MTTLALLDVKWSSRLPAGFQPVSAPVGLTEASRAGDELGLAPGDQARAVAPSVPLFRRDDYTEFVALARANPSNVPTF